MTSTDRQGSPRHTRQRTEIRQAVEDQETFATAQEIHDRLRHDGSGVGLATVYRTLQGLAAAGELDAIRTPDGQVAYRTCSPGHHHHLICRSCGRTVEVNIPSLETLIRALAAEQGFAQVEHELEFYGTCTDCARA
mgnify:FL=1